MEAAKLLVCAKERKPKILGRVSKNSKKMKREEGLKVSVLCDGVEIDQTLVERRGLVESSTYAIPP